jgi:hypothetical protein
MRISHDDQMRQAALRMAPAPSVVESDPPVLITRVVINRTLAANHVHQVRSTTLPRFRQANGAMREFLKTARSVQNLPSFAKRIRE